MKAGLFLGAWAWCGVFAAAGHTWAMHAFYLGLLGLIAYVVAVLLAGGDG
jgi:hypothetical protein